jgi:hypothetical protein
MQNVAVKILIELLLVLVSAVGRYGLRLAVKIIRRLR